MSGNPVVNVSGPGRNWHMIWGNGGFSEFQLDLVGFLAVLGEGALLANSQVSALSPLFYLPRLLPAPQALLPPSRPKSLPSTPASVTSVYSGNTKEHIHHVAHILLGQELSTFTVRCVEVSKPNSLRAPSRIATTLGFGKTSENSVTAKATGPLSWVTILGCFLSIALFVSSFILGDGMSLLATLLLSFLSTLTGVANKSKLKLPQRRPGAAPRGDTVIRYPNGSYLVVRCDEDVARELYFAPEEIEYQLSNPARYRLVSLLGTIVLMLGIICLANAKLPLQIAWTGAYIVTNSAHWIVAAVPQRMHWDLSSYQVCEQGVIGGPHNESFTEALWKAILLTKDTRWVKNGKAAPQTHVWDEWLVEAETQAQLAKYHVGPVEDTIFSEQPAKGIIWDVPKDWDPKMAWNRINQEDMQAKTGGALPANKAA